MLLGERQRIQRRQASRAPSVFNAQPSPNVSQELGDSSLHRQCAAQKEQIPGLHCFNISAEWSGWMRQIYAKVLQSSFGTGVRRVRRHEYVLHCSDIFWGCVLRLTRWETLESNFQKWETDPHGESPSPSIKASANHRAPEICRKIKFL